MHLVSRQPMLACDDVECVITTSYKHVGTNIIQNGSMLDEIKFRINKATSIYGRIAKKSLGNKSILLPTRFNLLQTLVFSVIFYTIRRLGLHLTFTAAENCSISICCASGECWACQCRTPTRENIGQISMSLMYQVFHQSSVCYDSDGWYTYSASPASQHLPSLHWHRDGTIGLMQRCRQDGRPCSYMTFLNCSPSPMPCVCLAP